MTVTVTQRHIDRGSRGSGELCAIAVALFDMGYEPDVRVDCVDFWSEGRVTDTIKLPKSAQQWITKYDRHERVRPFEFEMDEPNGF